MLFDNKKNKIIPPAEPFKKEKISPIAIDHFAQKYTFDKGSFPYTLLNGQQINFCPGSVIENPGGLSHYRYLLGQTAPYHLTNQKIFPLQYIAYTVDENNKPIPWCTDKKVLSQFVNIGQKLGYIILDKNLNFTRVPGVDPVIHTERTHTDD